MRSGRHLLLSLSATIVRYPANGVLLVGCYAGCVPKLDYDEIIALSEDPNVTAEDLDPGQPATPERYAELAEFADAVFLEECTLEEQIAVTRCLPADIAVRPLARMPEGDRQRILDQIPEHLAGEIVGLLPVGVP